MKRPELELGSKVIVGLDPGLRHCGVCILVDGVLYGLRVVKNTEAGRGGFAWLAIADKVFQYVLTTIECNLSIRYAYDNLDVYLASERMVVRSAKREVNADDLLELASVVGAIAGRMGVAPLMFKPEEWKGQVPKRIDHPRRIKNLSGHARAVLVADLFDNDPDKLLDYLVVCRQLTANETPPGLAHNALDALGIALRAYEQIENERLVDGRAASEYIRKARSL